MKKNTLILCTVLALLALGLSLTAQTTTKSSSPAAPIPDDSCTGADGAGGITDTIDIFNATAGLTDVDVRVEIDHTFRADLQFHVTFTGGGGTVILAADHGGFADNDYYATFDDAAATSCANTTAAMQCGSGSACSAANTPGPTCSPDSALSAFNGLTTPNTFTFALCDDAAADTGTLQVWEITATGPGLPVELQRFEIQ